MVFNDLAKAYERLSRTIMRNRLEANVIPMKYNKAI